ncbi:unnamed protein product [Kuraishia capsulata CBS 1993]|uniref:3-methyl-2-oxobutanoate hydroxymethyltransferase n=1 Tax=Kuraishia capsulata CBS 1993 TaxID=1382522 RepID=W6MWN0_9ASCO|nr:uncharacterized protein KUCA_T00003654001 [Kuraishia capsulata CBS 1993]CDK27675.1 unnamed protein product [Kuraishia capsulata CBS 1993]
MASKTVARACFLGRRSFSGCLRAQSTGAQSSPYSAPETAIAKHKPSTLKEIYAKYKNGTPISVVTAHDYISGKWADAAPSCDAVLIGDSLAMVAVGYPTTLEIPFDEFYYHCASVCRAVKSKYIIADLPYGSFESSVEKCIESSMRLMKLGKICSIKIEGAYEHEESISRLIKLGIPVTGHIGLKPQRFNGLEGFRVQGKTVDSALQILKEALFLQETGISLLVLEGIPHEIASYITTKLSIPTIGIGAGNGTSGQVLVQADLLGMHTGRGPKFVKRYEDLYGKGVAAIEKYAQEVSASAFPDNAVHTYPMKTKVLEEFLEQAEKI